MYKNIFIISLLFVCINTVSGETLSDITISSPVFTNSINESKYPLHILQNDEINTNRSIGDNLKGLSGITNADYGIAVGQPVIRGLTGSRIKILSNTVGVNDLSGLSADHMINVDLNNISHIEVLRGPSSIFVEGGTSGGIVNVISDILNEKKYDDEVIKYDRSYTSVNKGYANNFLIKKNLFNTNVFFSINNKHLDIYDIPDGALFEDGVEKGRLANSDHKNQNVNLGLSFPREWGYFGIAFEDNNAIYGIPFHAEEEGHDDDEGEHRIFSETRTETYTFKGKINTLPFFNYIDYSYRDSNSFLREHEEDGSATLTSNSNALSVKFNFDEGSTEQSVLLKYNNVESPMSVSAYIPSSESYDRSISYFTRHQINSYEVDFAGRYESNSRDSSEQRYGDTSVSFATSLSSMIGNSLFYNVGYAHVSRSPNIAELFAIGSHGPTQRYERGNNKLTREVSRNIELALQYNINDIDIDLNMYRNNISDFIYLRDLSTSTGGKVDANWDQQDGVMQGYELSISKSYQLRDGSLLMKISRDDISGVFDNNTYIPRITPAKNVLSLKYENKRDETYHASLMYADFQKDIAANETKTKSYIDIDLAYSKKIRFDSKRDLNIKVYGDNVLNKTIRNHSSFVKDNVPTPGANFGIDVSLSYKF